MGSLSAAFASANAPYNVYNVISGAQTTGVTLRTGSKVALNPPRNVSRLQITVDGTTPGILYWTKDSTVSAANLVGTPLPSGDNKEFKPAGSAQTISIPIIYFDIDTTGMILHIDWE